LPEKGRNKQNNKNIFNNADIAGIKLKGLEENMGETLHEQRKS
jgi:hypothetical protein